MQYVYEKWGTISQTATTMREKLLYMQYVHEELGTIL